MKYKQYRQIFKKINSLLIRNHKILPSTIFKSDLVAVLENGEEIVVEANIDVPKHNSKLRIKKLFLNPPVGACPQTLRRIKNASRYSGFGNKHQRSEFQKIIDELNSIISNKEWILGKNINKRDISILPFIRQFRIADSKWFDNQTSIPNIIRILNNFLESKLHKETMIHYKEWEEGSKPVYFPIFNSLD